MKKILLLIGSIILVQSCSNNEPEQEQTDFTLEGDTIVVPANSTLKPKLKTYVVKEEPHSLQMITAGTVKAIPNNYAEIAPPFPGRIVKSHIRLGQKVSQGSPLFDLSSADFFDAQKTLLQAKQEYKLAEQNLKRQQDLKKNGIGAEKDLEEAETNFDIQKKEYENAEAGLKLFGVNPDEMILGQPLTVRSPIDGEVIVNDLVVGKFIKDDASAVALVAELSRVWIVGQVKEKDIRFIHELDGAEIQVAAYPEKKIIGKVYHVEEIVDEATRSVQVLVEAANEDHTLKQGMYVTVKFIDLPQNALFVPSKAILQYNDKSFVFVQISNNKYVRRYVETGITEDGKVAIIKGLKANETIISEGAFYLLEAK